MHSILAAPQFQDIVAWDDHGRSFRILKPKNFESDILPLFFEHSKFSSYIRQTNGWGFRRFLSGPNRGSYYQEYFLRSMPWLCKKMRRPKVGEKKSIGLGELFEALVSRSSSVIMYLTCPYPLYFSLQTTSLICA
jgi:hypothetical protein